MKRTETTGIAAEAGTTRARAPHATTNAAAAPLRFPFADAPPTDGTLFDVAPGIKWLRMPLPLALDHINLYLIRDHDGWMIFDTGLGTEPTRALWRKIIDGPLAGQRITGVICTHFHFDHAGLAGWLTETLRVPLYMSYGEYYTLRVMAGERGAELPWEHAQFFQQSGFPVADLDAIMAVVRMSNAMITPPPASFRRLRHGETLTIGDRTWQLHVGEGHAPEHMLLYCAEDKLLLAGDQLLPRITSNVGILPSEPESDLLAYWFESLDRLAGLPADTLILPAHELPYYGLATRVAQLHEHHVEQFAILRKICSGAPQTAYDAALQMFPHRKSKMDDLMAMGECLAHLIHLRRRGEIERTLDGDGCYRYRTVTV